MLRQKIVQWPLKWRIYSLKSSCADFDGLKIFSDSRGLEQCFAAFSWDGRIRKWTVHLYSLNEVKVNEIAERFGGGGHPGAAGFVCDRLPEEFGVPGV